MARNTPGSPAPKGNDTGLVPSQGDLCVSADTMTMWGHDRTWLWDQPGLRTITLTRMTAAN